MISWIPRRCHFVVWDKFTHWHKFPPCEFIMHDVQFTAIECRACRRTWRKCRWHEVGQKSHNFPANGGVLSPNCPQLVPYILYCQYICFLRLMELSTRKIKSFFPLFEDEFLVSCCSSLLPPKCDPPGGAHAHKKKKDQKPNPKWQNRLWLDKQIKAAIVLRGFLATNAQGKERQRSFISETQNLLRKCGMHMAEADYINWFLLYLQYSVTYIEYLHHLIFKCMYTTLTFATLNLLS